LKKMRSVMLKDYKRISIFESHIDYLCITDAAIIDAVLLIRRQLIASTANSFVIHSGV